MGHPAFIKVCKFLRSGCPDTLGTSCNSYFNLQICHDPHLLLVNRLVNHFRLDDAEYFLCLVNQIAFNRSALRYSTVCNNV